MSKSLSSSALFLDPSQAVANGNTNTNAAATTATAAPTAAAAAAAATAAANGPITTTTSTTPATASYTNISSNNSYSSQHTNSSSNDTDTENGVDGARSPPDYIIHRGNGEGKLGQQDAHHYEFQSDFSHLIWMTYRRNFIPFNPPASRSMTSDKGWGCMLRSAQMILANTLMMHRMTRHWVKFIESSPPVAYAEVLQMFLDHPDAPFSIQRLVSLGSAEKQKAGEWYGPAESCVMIQRAVALSGIQDFTVIFTESNAIFLDQIVQACTGYSPQDILAQDRYRRQSQGSLQPTAPTDSTDDSSSSSSSGIGGGGGKRRRRRGRGQKGTSSVETDRSGKSSTVTKSNNNNGTAASGSASVTDIIRCVSDADMSKLAAIPSVTSGTGAGDFATTATGSSGGGGVSAQGMDPPALKASKSLPVTPTSAATTITVTSIQANTAEKNHAGRETRTRGPSRRVVKTIAPRDPNRLGGESGDEEEEEEEDEVDAAAAADTRVKKSDAVAAAVGEDDEEEVFVEPEEANVNVTNANVTNANASAVTTSIDAGGKPQSVPVMTRQISTSSSSLLTSASSSSITTTSSSVFTAKSFGTTTGSSNNPNATEHKQLPPPPPTASPAAPSAATGGASAGAATKSSPSGVPLDGSLTDMTHTWANPYDNWKSCLILIPLRLGQDNFDEAYRVSLLQCFQFPQSVGVIGGRPRASLYMVGAQGKRIFYLDPHTTQDALRGSDTTIKALCSNASASYRCSEVRSIDVDALDPSMSVGFYCRTQEDVMDLWRLVKEIGNGPNPVFTAHDVTPTYDVDDDDFDMSDDDEDDEDDVEEDEEDEDEEKQTRTGSSKSQQLGDASGKQLGRGRPSDNNNNNNDNGDDNGEDEDSGCIEDDESEYRVRTRPFTLSSARKATAATRKAANCGDNGGGGGVDANNEVEVDAVEDEEEGGAIVLSTSSGGVTATTSTRSAAVTTTRSVNFSTPDASAASTIAADSSNDTAMDRQTSLPSVARRKSAGRKKHSRRRGAGGHQTNAADDDDDDDFVFI